MEIPLMISLKNLRSLSLAVFALCFMSFTSEALAQRCPCKNELIYRTDAIAQSENLIGRFSLLFAAAVNAPDLATQEALVLELTTILTTPFTITFNISPMTTLVATDYASLLNLVQIYSAQSDVFSNLIGSISLQNYTKICRGLRNLDFNYLSYSISTATPGSSIIVSTGDVHIVEVSCDEFRIQSGTLTTINNVVIPALIP